MGCQAQLEGLERFVFAVAAGSLVCTYHKGSQEQAAGVRAGSEKGVAYHIAPCASDGVVFLINGKRGDGRFLAKLPVTEMGSKWEPAASADLSVRSIASLPHDIRVVPHFWIPMSDGEWAEQPGNTVVRATRQAL